MRKRFAVRPRDGADGRCAQLLRVQLEGGLRRQAQGRHAHLLPRSQSLQNQILALVETILARKYKSILI